MAKSYTRCAYFNENSQQCEVWFEKDESVTGLPLCDEHKRMTDPSLGDEQKKLYIDVVNDHKKFCYQMTVEELDLHIAGIEREIEAIKTKLFATRSVRAEKLDNLTENQRKERRKIKVDSAVREEAKKKKPTIKSDPVGYLMMTQNMTEAQARLILFGDV